MRDDILIRNEEMHKHYTSSIGWILYSVVWIIEGWNGHLHNVSKVNPIFKGSVEVYEELIVLHLAD